MSLPRAVVPGRFYLMTRRCTQQLFLMRPDQETTNAFLYCLALAASIFNIDVLITCAMSNHHHTVIFDREGTYPQFLEYFHRLFARSQNVLRNRRENFWSSAQASVVRLVDAKDVMRQIVYTACNPVKAHLVERAVEWPGATTYADLLAGRELVIERPTHFFRKNGPTPERVTLRCAIPAEIGRDIDGFLAELRRSVETEERRLAAERKRDGIRVLGAAAVLNQPWSRSPSSLPSQQRQPYGGRTTKIRPQIAAINETDREAALVENQEFVEAYRRARNAWLRRKRAEFPPGTYWLRRFARVRVATR